MRLPCLAVRSSARYIVVNEYRFDPIIADAMRPASWRGLRGAAVRPAWRVLAGVGRLGDQGCQLLGQIAQRLLEQVEVLEELLLQIFRLVFRHLSFLGIGFVMVSVGHVTSQYSADMVIGGEKLAVTILDGHRERAKGHVKFLVLAYAQSIHSIVQISKVFAYVDECYK